MTATPRESSDRATGVLFRMSHADKARIKRQAKEHGISVQALLERMVLGYEDAVTRPPGRVRRSTQDEELFGMTG